MLYLFKMNKKAQETADNFINVMINACLVTNGILIAMSVTLGDDYLFKIALISSGMLLLGKVSRYYGKKSKEDKK